MCMGGALARRDADPAAPARFPFRSSQLHRPSVFLGGVLMATRNFAQLAAVVLPACMLSLDPASAQIFHLEGEITNGAFFVPDPGGGPDIVFRNFPVAYAGIFNNQPASSLATFEFIPDTGGPTATQTIRENLFPGVLRNDAATLVVDYLTSPPQAFMTSFDLTLDKTTGQGSWEWHDLCLVCDRSVDPFAQATITSFRIIPEPSTLVFAIATFSLLAARRRENIG